jgi:hypothetical protein
MYKHGDYYLLDQRTGRKIRRSEAVRDPYGFIVHKDHADPRHPQENLPPPRVERVPTFISPEPTDTFLGPNDVQVSDF